jgi:arsenate reductase
MAEALVNHLFKGKWAAFSAGIMPMAIPKDVAVIMSEIGIDMSGHHSKHVDIFAACRFDRVVIICSDVDRFCPNLPETHVQDHMIFDDPLSSALLSEGICASLKSTLRSLRDEMKQRLTAYLNNA